MTILATILLGISRAAEDAEFDETAVTPGVLGFAVTAVFAVAVILLGADLVRRVRRSQYRAEIAEELQAELAAREDQQDPESAEGGERSSAEQEAPGRGDRASGGRADRSAGDPEG